MSTIAVDNVKPSAGGTSFSTRGVAKAWANLNGTGTIALRDSENVSSVTDNSTGRYTFSFTNSMSDGNYLSAITGGNNNVGVEGAWGAALGTATNLAGSVDSVHYNSAGSTQDQTQVFLTINGDLA